MKKHYMTNLEEVFVVSKIVTIYPSIALGPYRKEKGVTPQNFWQIIHTKDDKNTKVDGEEFIPLKKDALLFRAPKQTFYVGSESEEASERGIISFEISAGDMDFFRDKIFYIGVEEKRCLDEIYTIGASVFEIVRGEEYHGCKLVDNCSPVKLQRLKNTLERLIFILYEGALAKNEETIKQKNMMLVRDVKKYLMEHISEKLSLNDIAKNFMISSSTLKYAFKEVTGDGVISYFRDLKIEEAKKLLEEGALTMEEIAVKLGFDTSSYFSRVFHAKTGKTPSEYKNTVRNKNSRK